MWWSEYWLAPWMFFGPMMMFLLMVMCMVGIFFMMRMGTMYRSSAGPIGPRFPLTRQPADRPAAFEEYRAETLRRLDQEQKEFETFIGHLRMAKDKAEFDQFMTERRTRPSQA